MLLAQKATLLDVSARPAETLDLQMGRSLTTSECERCACRTVLHARESRNYACQPVFLTTCRDALARQLPVQEEPGIILSRRCAFNFFEVRLCIVTTCGTTTGTDVHRHGLGDVEARGAWEVLLPQGMARLRCAWKGRLPHSIVRSDVQAKTFSVLESYPCWNLPGRCWRSIQAWH